jgi:hypothetical protein
MTAEGGVAGVMLVSCEAWMAGGVDAAGQAAVVGKCDWASTASVVFAPPLCYMAALAG